ncbi:unnamed protein product, partial [Pseudo-nitzschia multistriata]
MDEYIKSYRDRAAENAAAEATASVASGTSLGGRASSIMSRMSVRLGVDAKRQRMERRHERSRAVATQGLFYAGTFMFVWLFGTITRGLQLANRSVPYGITLAFAFLTPSQGFFNFLVYVRPRFLQYLKTRKSTRESSRKSTGSDIIRVSGLSSTNEVSEPVVSADGDTVSRVQAPIAERPSSKRRGSGSHVKFATLNGYGQDGTIQVQVKRIEDSGGKLLEVKPSLESEVNKDEKLAKTDKNDEDGTIQIEEKRVDDNGGNLLEVKPSLESE